MAIIGFTISILLIIFIYFRHLNKQTKKQKNIETNKTHIK